MKGIEQQGDKSCSAGDGSVLGQPPQVAGADLWVIAQLCYFQEEQDGKEIQGLTGQYVSFPLCWAASSWCHTWLKKLCSQQQPKLLVSDPGSWPNGKQ